MPTGIPWDLRRRGLKDARRHDELVKEAVRKNLKRLIVEEAIISSDGHRSVKVPVRYLEQYRFRHGDGRDGEGVGQGPGDAGDVIARRQAGDGSGSGEAGDAPGSEVYEAEVSVDELTEMMMKDLKLPWLEPTKSDALKVDDIRFDDVRKRGLATNLDKRRTLLQHLKRQHAGGRSGLGAFHDDDLRYRVWSERTQPHARAAVYMLMDRSASMSTEKKYIAKSFYFWMTRFLRKKYDAVELVFIAHDVEAEIVDEQAFFTVSNSGGTRSSSAYHLAERHMKEYHPPSSWNTYLFYFSDGENLPSDNERCERLISEHLNACRVVGYGEILFESWELFYRGSVPGASARGAQRRASPLYRSLEAKEASNLMLVQIRSRDEVYEALRKFLRKEDTP